MHWLRRVFQISVLVAVAITGYRYAMGLTRITVETFCPFGGLEALLSLVSDRRFPCATGERNLMLFLALVLLTLLSRRVFCSWVCPVGTVSEGLLTLSKKLGIGKSRSSTPSGIPFSRSWDSRLRWLRVPILLSILLLTFYTGELIFRGVDPYYILFSFNGHDVYWWSYLFIGVILITVFIIPMAWCRYLCPLGGALWPLSRFGLQRLRRRETCISCKKCDAACPQGISVSEMEDVVTGECTLCLECQKVCPVEGALELRLRGGAKAPTVLIPILIITLTAGGLGATRFVKIPTVSLSFSEIDTEEATRKATFIVEGVSCKDRATAALRTLMDSEGIYKATAYASFNRIEILFNPRQIELSEIQKRFEGPVYFEETGEYVFNMFKVISIDGLKISHL